VWRIWRPQQCILACFLRYTGGAEVCNADPSGPKLSPKFSKILLLGVSGYADHENGKKKIKKMFFSESYFSMV